MSTTVWVDKSSLPWNWLKKIQSLIFSIQFDTVVRSTKFRWSEKSYQVKNSKQENKLSYLSLATFVLLAPQNDELVGMPGEKSEEKRRCIKI